MKKKSTLLIDMDCILVDMLSAWLDKYNKITGENVRVTDIKEYDMVKVCNEEVLYGILNEENFFYDMLPMPGAVEGLTALMEDGYDIVVVTQPPRKGAFAIRDKQRWMLKYLPNFDLRDMIFCHRKDMIRGDLLFDDKPEHLVRWKRRNPKGLTATLDWCYNYSVEADFHGSTTKGWEAFVEFVRERLR